MLTFGSEDPSQYSISKNRTEAKCDLLDQEYVGVLIQSFEMKGTLGG